MTHLLLSMLIPPLYMTPKHVTPACNTSSNVIIDNNKHHNIRLLACIESMYTRTQVILCTEFAAQDEKDRHCLMKMDRVTLLLLPSTHTKRRDSDIAVPEFMVWATHTTNAGLNFSRSNHQIR